MQNTELKNTSPSPVTFDYKKAALEIRVKFSASKDKLDKAKNTAHEESRANVASLNDFKLRVQNDVNSLAEICKELGNKKLIKPTQEKSLADVFKENFELCIVKYVFVRKNSDGNWDYNRSYNIHALVLRQLDKLEVKEGDAEDFIKGFKFGTNKNGTTAKSGIQALVEKDRLERDIGTQRETQHTKARTDVAEYFNSKGSFATIEAADCMKANVQNGAFGEYVPLLGRINADGSITVDRVLHDEGDFTRKLVLGFKKAAKEWKTKLDAETSNTDEDADAGEDSNEAEEAESTVSAADFEEFSQKAV